MNWDNRCIRMTRRDMDKILIFDTTLRDGEQSPGCSMTADEKVRIAAQLDLLGVDVLEAGFPAASPGDAAAVRRVAENVKNAGVAALARARPGDIDTAAEALKPAVRPRLHTFIATSPLHMRVKLDMTEDQVLEAVAESVMRARNLVEDVEWSAEDASRSDDDFLCRCVETAIQAGASTVNIPDTVGYTVPEEFYDRIAMLKARVPNIDRAVISVHCHNDLGMAVANSLAAIRAGARQVECTINGIGERAGNAALEEIVMALRTRADALGVKTGIDTTQIMRTSRLISVATGFPIQPNKAIVGTNAFAHESGIHQDGMLKDSQTYEIMTPESVGLTQSELVLGKHSGRHALRSKLEELGLKLGDNAFEDLFARFKRLADQKKRIFEDDILALIDDAGTSGAEPWLQYGGLTVHSHEDGSYAATMRIRIHDQLQETTEAGTGPVDAIFKAIRKLVPEPPAQLSYYTVDSVTGGTDAQAIATLRLELDGMRANGQGTDADTLAASARAYLSALNRLAAKQARSLSSEKAGELEQAAVAV